MLIDKANKIIGLALLNQLLGLFFGLHKKGENA